MFFEKEKWRGQRPIQTRKKVTWSKTNTNTHSLCLSFCLSLSRFVLTSFVLTKRVGWPLCATSISLKSLISLVNLPTTLIRYQHPSLPTPPASWSSACSAARQNTGDAYATARIATGKRRILANMGHPQPPTPLYCGNEQWVHYRPILLGSIIR